MAYDNGLFDIDSSTGEITFVAAPDFEDPQGDNADNTYVANVRATDNAGNSTDQIVNVSVNDVNEAPVATSKSITLFDDAVDVDLGLTASDPEGTMTITVGNVQ